MKKYIIIILLIFPLLFLSACDKREIKIDKNFIMLSIEQNANGTSKQSIVFGVNSDFLRENSKNIQEELQFKQNLLKNVENIRNEFLFSFALIYMQNPVEKYKINQGVVLSQVGYNADGDYIGFEISFTSLGAWQYYHPSNKSQENNQKNSKNDNIFYKKQINMGNFPFSSSLSDGSNVGEKYKSCYISSAKGMSFENKIKDQYKPDFVYNYCTFYPKFHSNADVEFKGTNNQYYHIWLENDLKNCKNIELILVTIYKGWWIFFALLIPLGVMAITITVIKIKNKRLKVY